MVKKTTSVLTEILGAAELFNAAKKQQFTAIGKLFEIFLRANGDLDITKEIEDAFENLDSKHKPKKCKTLSSKIGWLAFPNSKQRVSDAHKIMEAAKGEIKSAEGLANWIESFGGLRATLLALSDVRHQASGEGSSNLKRKLSSAINALEENAKNRRTSSTNPTEFDIESGTSFIQITSFANGTYTVVEAVFDGVNVSFPKQVKQKKQSLDALAKSARSVSVTPSEAAAVNA